MKLYVAGPMTGLPEFNYPAFFAAAERLEKFGYDVLNPARLEGREDCKTWSDYLRVGLADVCAADGVALLPGWEGSKGARLEVHVAESLGLRLWSVDGWVQKAIS